MSDEAFGDMLSDMTADNGALGNLIAEGNAQAMCGFVGSITSLLNSKAEPEPVVITTTAAPTRGPARSPKEVAEEEARRSDLGYSWISPRHCAMNLGGSQS